MAETHTASCHCGAVRYEADIDLSTEKTIRCNCSYCLKSRAWLAFVQPDKFRLLSGEDALTEYQWTPPGKPGPFIHYKFCGTCGVRAFAHGGDEKTGIFYAINVAALDDADPDDLVARLGYIDGANNNFKAPPADTRLL
jgi:hypothetical protein